MTIRSSVRDRRGRHALRTIAAATMIVPGLLAVAPSASAAPSVPNKSGDTWKKMTVTAAMKESPSDAALRSATRAQRLRLATRCAPFDGLTYCLKLGWTTTEEAEQTRAAASPETNPGDIGLLNLADQWAGLSEPVRRASEEAEFAEAASGAGKARLIEFELAGRPVPRQFWDEYPAVAAWAASRTGQPAPATGTAPLVSGAGDAATGTTASTATISALPPMPRPPQPSTAWPLYAWVGSVSRGMKQSTGYWCGPTSAAIMAWNDPEVSGTVSHSQSTWANYLGTTTSGTAITSMATQITNRLTWDKRTGMYIVISISDKSWTWWRNAFQWHYRSPIILHPKLSPSVSSYYPGTTSGHFNVGRGYDYSYTQDRVSIYEPAGSAYGVPTVVSENTYYVRLANLNNSNFKNIGY